MTSYLNRSEGHALNIQEVESPSHIPVWFVEDRSTSIIHLHFSLEAGSAYEPIEKNGLTSLLVHLLTEGAGDLDAESYQTILEDHAIQLQFSNGRDYIYGVLKTLSRNKDKAFKLLQLALNSPRFDEESIERIRLSLINSLQESEQNPSSVAIRHLFHTYFNQHPYSKHPDGTIDSLKNLTRNDLITHMAKIRNRKRLRVVVVGDISKNDVKEGIESVFSTWNETDTLPQIPTFQHKKLPLYITQKLDIPQTIVTFAKPGLERDNEDYLTYQVMNYVFSDGSFSSRLMTEIREKQGLTYSIFSANRYYNHAALYLGKSATGNETVAKLVAELRNQFRLMYDKGVTPDELKEAKTYLTGSYLLNFSSGSSIARQLLAIYDANLSKDYIHTRNKRIKEITRDQVNAMAKKMLHDKALFFSFVGNPDEDKLTDILTSD